MTGISMEREIAVLDAVRAIHKRNHTHEAVISRAAIMSEILDKPREYGIRVDNINELRKIVTTVCNNILKKFRIIGGMVHGLLGVWNDYGRGGTESDKSMV